MDNNLPDIVIPNSKIIASFLQYHRFKERGRRQVGGQTVEDLEAFALEHEILVDTPRNVGGVPTYRN